jgi:hypothetical protein
VVTSVTSKVPLQPDLGSGGEDTAVDRLHLRMTFETLETRLIRDGWLRVAVALQVNHRTDGRPQRWT